jgi:hypothetical protein
MLLFCYLFIICILCVDYNKQHQRTKNDDYGRNNNIDNQHHRRHSSNNMNALQSVPSELKQPPPMTTTTNVAADAPSTMFGICERSNNGGGLIGG